MIRYLAGAWTIAVVVALWMPPSDPAFDLPHLDKLIHMVAFAGVAWLWRRAGYPGPAVAIGAAALAALTEAGQSFLPWPRTADLFDVAADLAGVAIGLALVKRQRRPEAASRRNGRDSNPR